MLLRKMAKITKNAGLDISYKLQLQTIVRSGTELYVSEGIISGSQGHF